MGTGKRGREGDEGDGAGEAGGTGTDLYASLGVKKDASASEIRKAYQRYDGRGGGEPGASGSVSLRGD